MLVTDAVLWLATLSSPCGPGLFVYHMTHTHTDTCAHTGIHTLTTHAGCLYERGGSVTAHADRWNGNKQEELADLVTSFGQRDRDSEVQEGEDISSAVDETHVHITVCLTYNEAAIMNTHRQIKSKAFFSTHFNLTEGQAYASVLSHLCSCPQYSIMLPFTARTLHCCLYGVEVNSWGFPFTNICFI